MSTPKFYFKNLLDAADLTASASDADNPKENVQDRDRHSAARPPTTADWYLDVDAGTAQRADHIIIITENGYDQTVGLRVITDNADNPSFSNPIYLVGSAGTPHASTAADQPFWFETLGGVVAHRTKRYWRIYFSGHSSAALRINDIYVTDDEDPGRHPGGAWSQGSEHQTAVATSKGLMSVTNWGEPRALLGLQFLKIPKAFLDTCLNAEKTILRGNFLPFFYTDEHGTLRLVRHAAPIRWQHHFGQGYDMAMQLAEEI